MITIHTNQPMDVLFVELWRKHLQRMPDFVIYTFGINHISRHVMVNHALMRTCPPNEKHLRCLKIFMKLTACYIFHIKTTNVNAIRLWDSERQGVFRERRLTGRDTTKKGNQSEVGGSEGGSKEGDHRDKNNYVLHTSKHVMIPA